MFRAELNLNQFEKPKFDHRECFSTGETIPRTNFRKENAGNSEINIYLIGCMCFNVFRDDLLEFLEGGCFYDFLLDTFFDMSSNSASEMFSIRLLAER